MRSLPILLAILVALLLATPMHSAQMPASGTLIQFMVEDFPPDGVATFGITRTSYGAGGSLRLVTASGPMVSFVESGALTLTVRDGSPPRVVGGTLEETGTPAAIESGSKVVVTAGNGFLLAPVASVEIHNDGPAPAAVLELLSAADAAAEAGEGVTQAVLVRQEVTLTGPAATVTLGRIVLEPGDRLSLAEAPALTVYAAVERERAFLLSGQGVNRATEPLDAYVLEIAPPENQS